MTDDEIQPCRFCGSHSLNEYVRCVMASSDPNHLRDPETEMVKCQDCGAEASRLVWQRPPLPVNVEHEREHFEYAMVEVFTAWRERGNSLNDNGSPATREALCWRQPDGTYGVLSMNMAWTGWIKRAMR